MLEGTQAATTQQRGQVEIDLEKRAFVPAGTQATSESSIGKNPELLANDQPVKGEKCTIDPSRS